MHIKEDPRFAEAVRCLLATWLAQDAGERADGEAERYRSLAFELADAYADGRQARHRDRLQRVRVPLPRVLGLEGSGRDGGEEEWKRMSGSAQRETRSPRASYGTRATPRRC